MAKKPETNEGSTTTVDPQSNLRKSFDRKAIGLLPKTTCRDCGDSKSKVCDKHRKAKCPDCGNYMTTAHMHLDYVGHAAVTDRLLSVDPNWTWEPMAVSETGLPVGDSQGNLWIKLTVNGISRPGVGDGANMKERIGDAIRNAAMRFGVALDLWSKEELESVIADPSLKNEKPSADIRDPADIEAEEEAAKRMVELGDQLWDLLKNQHAARKVRITLESLPTVQSREEAINALSRRTRTTDEDKPIDLDATPEQLNSALDAIDLDKEADRRAGDDDELTTLFKEAKQYINVELDALGHNNEIKKKGFVHSFLNKSTVDTQQEADHIIEAIELAKKQAAKDVA